jgi:hypothetical protein
MATNRPTGGRRGAIRNRTQFRLPNGHYAKVNRATGKIIGVKADRNPWKGVVITAAPSRLPGHQRQRANLPQFAARQVRQPRMPATSGQMVTLPVAIAAAREDLAA